MPLTGRPSSQGSFRAGWARNAPRAGTDVSRALQAGVLVVETLQGTGREFIHSELGKPIPGWTTTLGFPMGVPRAADSPRPHLALARRTVFGRICWLGSWNSGGGGLAPSTVSYGGQRVQKDHADLNTLRASHTHQENTPSYSRKQEMGPAAVEQHSMKQASVSFPSHIRQGLGDT